jgi:4-hydroxy-tetrahydrodipicolinate synthase
LLTGCGTELSILSGDDPTAADTLLAGVQGVISVTANVAPALVQQLVTAAVEGDSVRARALDLKLQPLHRAMFVEPNPIPAKWALSELGLIGAGIRLPLTPLSSAGQISVREAMRAVGVS